MSHDDSGFASPSHSNPSHSISSHSNYENHEMGPIKFKLIKKNTGALVKHLAPTMIDGFCFQTLAAAIKGQCQVYKVERRLFWAQVLGHDDVVAVNPFSFPCFLLKSDEPDAEVYEQIPQNIKELFYNTKELKEEAKYAFFVKTANRYGLRAMTKLENKNFDGRDVCVTAMENETLQEALERDGRFKNIGKFILRCGPDSTSVSMSAKAINYHNTTFSVAIRNNNQIASSTVEVDAERTRLNTASEIKESDDEDVELNVYTGEYKFSKSPRKLSRKEMLDEMDQLIHANAKMTLVPRSQREAYTREIPRIVCEQFAMHEYIARPAKLSKEIAEIFPSVGKISCGDYSASCFLLTQDVVTTNYHVVLDILKCQEEASDRQAYGKATVNFNYDIPGQPDQGDGIELASFDDPRNVFGKSLDFAFLALKSTAHGKTPLGPRVRKHVPNMGLVSIIGHPHGKEKVDDTAGIVSRGAVEIDRLIKEQEEICSEHPEECNRIVRDTESVKCIHLYNPDINLGDNKDVMSYHSSTMFHGSSGSPVINMNGKIVGIHSRGYSLIGKNRKTSLLEYCFTFRAVIEHLYERGLSHKVDEFFPYFEVERMDTSQH